MSLPRVNDITRLEERLQENLCSGYHHEEASRDHSSGKSHRKSVTRDHSPVDTGAHPSEYVHPARSSLPPSHPPPPESGMIEPPIAPSTSATRPSPTNVKCARGCGRDAGYVCGECQLVCAQCLLQLHADLPLGHNHAYGVKCHRSHESSSPSESALGTQPGDHQVHTPRSISNLDSQGDLNSHLGESSLAPMSSQSPSTLLVPQRGLVTVAIPNPLPAGKCPSKI
eukprot:gene1851-1972_t